MKDKVKRRRIVNQRKVKDLLSKYNNPEQNNPGNLAYEKQKQALEKQQNDYDKIVIDRLKLKLLKKRTKELNQEFVKTKRSSYSTYQEFWTAYKNVRFKRHEVIKKHHEQLKLEKQIYSETYETVPFKIKRWFFGMGKEFSRIRWSTKKTVIANLIVVVSITIFLAIIFFIIDLIFSIL